jgi:hypothetical protein
MRSPTLLLIHGGQSTVRKLEEALPGARVGLVYVPDKLSAGYDERTGIASQYKTLPELMSQYAPWWRPGDPLVLLGFSAGGWALRYYLRDAAARSLITAAIFLDATYGNQGEQCIMDRWEGAVAYAKEANADPADKRLIMTYSPSHPGPRVCATAIEREAGAGPGVFVQGFNTDHGSQQGVIAPKMVAELITPWIGGARGSGIDMKTAAGILLIATGLGLVYVAYA